MPGPEIRAIYNASVAEITPFLGRPLAGGIRSRNIELLPRATLCDQRLNQLDIGFTKIFRLADAKRLEVMFHGYNLLNWAAPLIINTAYGPQWLEPDGPAGGPLLQGRRAVHVLGRSVLSPSSPTPSRTGAEMLPSFFFSRLFLFPPDRPPLKPLYHISRLTWTT